MKHGASSQFADKTLPLKQRPEPLLPVLVRAVDASGGGSTYRLAAGVCLIGTSKGAHVRVTDPAVSRQHCELELTPGGVVLTDLESTNGTYYLGQRADRIVLAAGSSFTVGGVTIRLESDVDRTTLEPSAQREIGGLQADSLALRQIFAVIERLRDSTVPVLIEGESGVGKEMCARALHATSPVVQGRFVSVRCSALAPEALAAELFGDGSQAGAVQQASGGTLFLDHVDALTSALQQQLLELLEGGAVPGKAPAAALPAFRLLASSAPGLDDRLNTNTFSEGLYFRTAVVRLVMPPLRERREDIACLAEHFAREFHVELAPEVLEQLRSRAWPGNVRELRSVVQAYAALGVLPPASRVRGSLLDLALDEAVDLSVPYAEQKDAVVDRFTRRYLEALMLRAGGNQSVASRLADLDRTYLGKMLAKHGLKEG